MHLVQAGPVRQLAMAVTLVAPISVAFSDRLTAQRAQWQRGGVLRSQPRRRRTRSRQRRRSRRHRRRWRAPTAANKRRRRAPGWGQRRRRCRRTATSHHTLSAGATALRGTIRQRCYVLARQRDASRRRGSDLDARGTNGPASTVHTCDAMPWQQP